MRQSADGRFARGASSMVGGVFIAKLLGIFLIVPLQNLIGNNALGIYQQVYPLYNIMLTLSTAGLPLAVSRTISDLAARGEHKEAAATYSIVGRTLLFFGFAAFLIMWFAGPLFISGSDAGPAFVRQATPAVRSLAPALLILPLMSVQRGYLQGNLRLEPSAASQVLEQLVRVGVVLTGLIVAVRLGAGESVTAAIATFGGTAGAMAAFVLLLRGVRRLRRELARRSRHAPPVSLNRRVVLRQLFVYSLPIALGTLVLPVSQSIDAWTVIRELRAGGVPIPTAVSQYAIYSGEALRLMAAPLSFATAIGASVMPAITGAVARHNREQAQFRMLTALRMTAFTTLPAVALLVALALPIDVALFRQTEGAEVIAISAFICIFSALELVSTYILQGFGVFYRPVAHMAAGALVKLVLNLLLIPDMGIAGAALATLIGYMVSSWMNMASVRRTAGVRITFLRASGRTAVAALCAGIWFWGWERGYAAFAHATGTAGSRWLALGCVLLGLVVGAPLYLAVAMFTRAIRKSELAQIPVVGRYLAGRSAR